MKSNKQIVIAIIMGIVVGIGIGGNLELSNPKNEPAQETSKPLTISELSEKQKEKITFRDVPLIKLLDFAFVDYRRTYIYKIEDIKAFNSLSMEALAEFAQSHSGMGVNESKEILFYINTPELSNIEGYEKAIKHGWLTVPTAIGTLPYKKITSYTNQQTICMCDIDKPYYYKRAYWRTMYNDWMWRSSNDVASSCSMTIKLD